VVLVLGVLGEIYWRRDNGVRNQWFRTPFRCRYAPTLTRAKAWIVIPASSATLATETFESFA
jgi:hypothetical protein